MENASTPSQQKINLILALFECKRKELTHHYHVLRFIYEQSRKEGIGILKSKNFELRSADRGAQLCLLKR
ncbi:hypothetical protein ABEB36_008936 [Hypothenemus hampei]|uniref:Uncharacterized protein n=1 Tax=Hypothenemus hampei TaxID=57062 RepID=A0ABD1ENK1_HYPHA